MNRVFSKNGRPQLVLTRINFYRDRNILRYEFPMCLICQRNKNLVFQIEFYGISRYMELKNFISG